uniref:Interferon alpha/beta receptor 1, Interferon I interferon signaling complex n=1 Tax=Siphoviridae sp. ctvok7 TaxID=2827596 RepID=A0A8S5LLP5_9CAUD|nr:MAG TPA: Interferon alpha/beta receptor 1, Interferon I interferon signaling complex [Siphoviridae sp. ctvok7]
MAQLLSQVAVGTIVKLNESGSPVNYLVVHQGLPSDLYDSSCNGTWLLRQDIIQNGTWNTSNANILPNSAIMHAMASILPLYDQPIRDAIQTVKIPYCVGNGSSAVNSGANGLQCQIFPLSGREVGFTNNDSPYFPNDGSKLDYFISGNDSSARQRRVANLNGSATRWWLRSPYTSSASSVWSVNSNGSYDSWNASGSYGVRPALVLSSTLYVEDDGTISVAPPAPDSITVPPSATVGQSIAVNWSSVSGATQYKLERQADSGSWDTVYTGSGTSYTDTAQAGWQSVVYRVSAGVSDVFGDTKTSSAVSVSVATPTGLTVPSALMVSQTATISWDAVTGADSYKLERQVNSAGDWSTLYTGADLSYQDTAPSAAGTVTYRVSAGASGVYGAPATSAPVTVLAASALVISGTDGDLGTITAPVTYNVLTDAGNSVTVVENVDGTERTLTLTSGQEVSIPVARLTPGAGGITIKATVQATSGPVSVTRTWTYSKTPVSAPSGPYKVDQLQDQSGNMIAPQTLAEAVFLPSGESVAGRALSRNVVRTLPVAPGYSVSAGDVVDVDGGQVVKTDESSTAIALQSGTAGQSIECIFSGTTNAAWATEGQVIDSPGVYGVGIMDGILQVWSKERPRQVVTGSYVGTGQYGGTHPNSITFPFIPLFWGVYMTYFNERYDQAGNFLEWNVSGKVTLKDDYDAGYTNTVSYSGNTVSWYAGGDTEQLNDERTTYYYFAIGQGGAT